MNRCPLFMHVAAFSGTGMDVESCKQVFTKTWLPVNNKLKSDMTKLYSEEGRRRTTAVVDLSYIHTTTTAWLPARTQPGYTEQQSRTILTTGPSAYPWCRIVSCSSGRWAGGVYWFSWKTVEPMRSAASFCHILLQYFLLPCFWRKLK